MLRLTVSTEEYLMINDNIKIIFLGGTKNHLRIMVDAPKEVNIVRSTVLENQITDPEERAKLPKYYAEPEHPEKYVKKRPNIYITHGNVVEGKKGKGQTVKRQEVSK
uniref:carbon storage regulator n=1 Tax=Acetatifactor sp. TaxID=1872090 RepID=UPI004056C14C